MTQFRKIDDRFYASPQISADDIAAAAKLGITAIVNNRPEGEDADQPEGETIAAEARAAGLNYVAIPVTHAGIGQGQVDAMLAAVEDADGPVLAYCRSGTRSTMLWALAAAKRGDPPAVIASKAAQAGYDVSPIRQMIDMLSAGRAES
ncbi:TIGR01244 family sulfur transferase [uncultured Croceicoccus sp.]|uniref:TIGR01244 family sulfur transferase n=1 Tax=uncultured Croceicoccus sp. TaxID=1295329 RepID=UPI002638CE3F|nr:TIGR01244 family sulfur transferase [uncultured Croceicoccus sp.]